MKLPMSIYFYVDYNVPHIATISMYSGGTNPSQEISDTAEEEILFRVRSLQEEIEEPKGFPFYFGGLSVSFGDKLGIEAHNGVVSVYVEQNPPRYFIDTTGVEAAIRQDLCMLIYKSYHPELKWEEEV